MAILIPAFLLFGAIVGRLLYQDRSSFRRTFDVLPMPLAAVLLGGICVLLAAGVGLGLANQIPPPAVMFGAFGGGFGSVVARYVVENWH